MEFEIKGVQLVIKNLQDLLLKCCTRETSMSSKNNIIVNNFYVNDVPAELENLQKRQQIIIALRIEKVIVM